MKSVIVICSDERHPVNAYLEIWIESNRGKFSAEIVRSVRDLYKADFLFLVSCSDILNELQLGLFTYSLVLHASDLPKGRGWSPHIWELLDGASHLTVALLEVVEKVDSGPIWKKVQLEIPRGAVKSEIDHLLFSTELELMNYAIENAEHVVKTAQSDAQATYYRRRTPADSEISADMRLDEFFDLLRIADPNRYPVRFRFRGRDFKLHMDPINGGED